ncbi:hypothetical protein B0I35DRAFT_422830, partial [Stachybotrys elegans]
MGQFSSTTSIVDQHTHTHAMASGSAPCLHETLSGCFLLSYYQKASLSLPCFDRPSLLFLRFVRAR